MNKKSGFVGALSGLALKVYSVVVAHPILVSLSLVATLTLLWWFRTEVIKHAKAAVRVSKPWVLNGLLLIGAVKSGYEAYEKQSDPWAGGTLSILFFGSFLWKGIKDKQSEKEAARLRLDDLTKNLREQVVRVSGDDTTQAYLYVNRRDVLTLEAASRQPWLTPSFKVGEGICGAVVDDRVMKTANLTRFAGESYFDMVTANKGTPVLNMTADQWEVSRSACSILGVPLVTTQGWVMAVLVISSEKPMTKSGLTRARVHEKADMFLADAMRGDIERIR